MRPHFAEYLATFVDVVRAGSFSGAARRRAVTPSAVVRQIDALEEDLGVALLIRSTRALTLTDAGQRLHERALRHLDELADTHAEVAAFDGSVSGTLRIACFPTFGKRYVLPVVAALQAEHPALHVELDLTERLADPVAERLDAVIRMGALADSTLIATRLAPLHAAAGREPRLSVAGGHAQQRRGSDHRIDCSTSFMAPICLVGATCSAARRATPGTARCRSARMISKPCARRRRRAWESRSCRAGLSDRMSGRESLCG